MGDNRSNLINTNNFFDLLCLRFVRSAGSLGGDLAELNGWRQGHLPQSNTTANMETPKQHPENPSLPSLFTGARPGPTSMGYALSLPTGQLTSTGDIRWSSLTRLLGPTVKGRARVDTPTCSNTAGQMRLPRRRYQRKNSVTLLYNETENPAGRFHEMRSPCSACHKVSRSSFPQVVPPRYKAERPLR